MTEELGFDFDPEKVIVSYGIWLRLHVSSCEMKQEDVEFTTIKGSGIGEALVATCEKCGDTFDLTDYSTW